MTKSFNCFFVAQYKVAKGAPTWGAVDETLEIPFVLHAVDRALEKAHPEIWNSDQGSQFTNPKYTQRLQDADVKISMDGRGRALDNIFNERL